MLFLIVAIIMYIYLAEYILEKTEEAIRNGQSREPIPFLLSVIKYATNLYSIEYCFAI